MASLSVFQRPVLQTLSSSGLLINKCPIVFVSSAKKYTTAIQLRFTEGPATSINSRLYRQTYKAHLSQNAEFSSQVMDVAGSGEVKISQTFVEKLSSIKSNIVEYTQHKDRGNIQHYVILYTAGTGEVKDACGTLPEDVDDEEMEMEDMFVATPMGSEWGGPMRGGRLSEPTRFGDWERKGRCSDF